MVVHFFDTRTSCFALEKCLFYNIFIQYPYGNYALPVLE